MSDANDSGYVESALTDLLLRLIVAVAVTFFAITAFRVWHAHPERITVLLLAVIETITVVIILCSRRAHRRDWRPLSVLASFVAMFYFLALDLTPTRHPLPEMAGAALQLTGLALQLYAKLSLGRSFGVLPATRELVTRGAYRWLRHPIYFGYLVAQLGFLFSNFCVQNIVVLVVLYAAQILRIHREEEFLHSFAGYGEYCERVRYRLIPFVY